MKYNYLIVGAGLSSSVFARQMTDAGYKCLVIDKRNHIAGNIYTENIEGIEFHKYGAHIFHTSNDRVWEFVNNYTKFNNYTHCPVANYNGTIYNLPFNMNTFSKMWGITSPSEAKLKIAEQVKNSGITEPKNLEEQAKFLVGEDIYEKLIRYYTEKQWERKCSDLPSFIIKRLPVRLTYDNNYFNDKYQGIPENGYTELIENMLKGIDVQLNTEYSDFINQGEIEFDKVYYTGMIDEFFNFKFGNLDYRSLRFETSIEDTDNYQGVSVMNYVSDKEKFTRIIEHKHFSKKPSDKTIITKEYSLTYKKGEEPYYPINDDKNSALYEKYCEHAKCLNGKVIFGGRLGTYKYYDMDKAIENALIQADKELEG